jgi:hypothetical protein
MRKNIFLFTTFILVSSISLLNGISSVSAQSQGITPTSGNDAASYLCFDNRGSVDTSIKPYLDSSTGYYMCTADVRATLRPPTFQALELWFRRILYAIWALVASFSFVMLIYLGYRYMLRGGTTDSELVKLRKDIFNYIIGFALVFLSIPILTTIFNLLGIRDDVVCYDVAMPGFQFFFPKLCTDPYKVLVDNPCTQADATGYACNDIGKTSSACFDRRTGTDIYYICTAGGIWERQGGN